ncbi:pyruvate dehydrogenase (acetyl-transferring) E1 component subunit alpha [Isoptericola sp. NEAU-Y5]|uniref:Pyruvate dehydrogenase (Acetyl-transferring) E1 component subunit alpha n=1 Tax=Isoptericola luteus TaxID=2879484 RepID=A0ABS7ZB84_9MICO|nr:pyruvate dehydrogenase (acetyl-transferring) E1 component subunit alpha [Isoptericola sp. NEAU-Y5]MCA5892304.1 pyruvate dehydrogenase (acetyl-transferring) E1 component subunit alpha [Isoptericola sp. NEAU-Y5]
MPDTMGDAPREDLPQAGATTVRETSTNETTQEQTDTAVRLVDAKGVRHPDPELDRWLTDVDAGTDEADATLLRLYSDMVTARRLDTEATALQRQGELALWPPLLGQEAAQVGSARAMRGDDFVFSSYREHAVALVRGVTPAQLTPVWRGVTASGWDPYTVGMATPQVIIGAQTLHAVGYGLGVLADAERDPGSVGDDGTAAVVTYFGDGAISQGDVSEALVFAATWSVPVIFFCQNNQWAISEPVRLQSPVALADRAAGFGMPGVQVDGNDVLAVLAVTRAALHRARTGGGPTLIEAVTYRMGPHTTADDPTRYRDAEEVASWADRDPIERFGAWLRTRGTLDDEAERRVREEADAVAAELRAGCIATEDPPALQVFENVYATPHAALDAERDTYAAYLATLVADAADAGTHGGAR